MRAASGIACGSYSCQRVSCRWRLGIRLGIQLPNHGQPFVALHGAFMICGFLGTVICLERAVAYDRAWVYAAPLL